MDEEHDSFEYATKQKGKRSGGRKILGQKPTHKVNILDKSSRSDTRFNSHQRGARAMSPSTPHEKLFCKSDIPKEALNEEFQILLSPTQSQIVVKLTNPLAGVEEKSAPLVGRDGLPFKDAEKGKKKGKSLAKDASCSGRSTPIDKKGRGKRYSEDDSTVDEYDSEGKSKRRQSKSSKARKLEDDEESVIIDIDGVPVSFKRTASGHYVDDSGNEAKLGRTASGGLLSEDGRRAFLQRKRSNSKGKFYWKTSDGRFIDADGREGHFSRSPTGRFINEEGRKGRFKRGSDGSYFFQYDKDKGRPSEDDSRRQSRVGRERITKKSSGRFVDHDGKEIQGPFRRTSSGSYVDGRGKKGRFRLSPSGFYYFDTSDPDPFHRTKSGRFLDADGKEGKYRLTPDGRYVDEFGNEVSEEEVMKYYSDGDISPFNPRKFSLANALYSLGSEPGTSARQRHSRARLKSLDKVGEIGPVPFEEKKVSISFAKTSKPKAIKSGTHHEGPRLLRADEIEIYCNEGSDSTISDADSGSILFKIDLESPPETKGTKKKKKGPMSRIKGRNKRFPSLFLKTRYIKFKGWDVGLFTKPDTAVRLPCLVDNAESLVKYTSRKKMSYVYDEDEDTEANSDSRAEAIQYLANYGISELLQFLFYNLAKEKPPDPYDFTIELLRAISRLMSIRAQSYDVIEERLRWAMMANPPDKKMMHTAGITPMASLVSVDVSRDVCLFPSPVPSKIRLSPILSTKSSGQQGGSPKKNPLSRLSMEEVLEDN